VTSRKEEGEGDSRADLHAALSDEDQRRALYRLVAEACARKAGAKTVEQFARRLKKDGELGGPGRLPPEKYARVLPFPTQKNHRTPTRRVGRKMFTSEAKAKMIIFAAFVFAVLMMINIFLAVTR
jgi:hypothetical protein